MPRSLNPSDVKPTPPPLPEIRCNNVIVIGGRMQVCNMLMMKGEIVVGVIEKKCQRPGCGKIHRITGSKGTVAK